jgi:hypothetical protein
VKILGSNAVTTIIDGGGVGRVVTISSTTAHVTLSALTIRNGIAPSSFIGRSAFSSGGGINNSGTLTLTNGTVSGNRAPIPCIHGLLFCQFSAGFALGGGIYNSGTLIISNSIISGNHAGSYCNGGGPVYACSASGGGIYNRGTLVMIKNSTLTDNSAGTACGSGYYCPVGVGGAFYTDTGKVTLNNSTVEGSSAYICDTACSGRGGAIVVNGLGNLAINNSTISGNSAGGTVGTATLANSIIANNFDANCRGTITSHGYNLSSDSSCAFSNSGDQNDTNPMLGSLGYYGGPTPTIPLLTGSPAIDAGNPSGCTDGSGHLLKTYQRGMPRPDREDKSGCDMGAYERQSD